MHWAQLSSDPRDGGTLLSDCTDRLEAARQYAFQRRDEDGVANGQIRIWEEGTFASDATDFIFEFSGKDELKVTEYREAEST